MASHLKKVQTTAGRHDRLFLSVILVLLTLLLVVAILPNLGHFPKVSGDDVWITSVSYKLANEGLLGSDMFVGFFNADKYHFMSMPLNQIWYAAVFKVLGLGIAQARLLPLVVTISLLWLVSWLAYRWFGVATATITAILLVLWRSALTGSGIPYLLVGRTARFDLTAVWWMWVAIAVLYLYRKRPAPYLAFALGLACGLATLTQFFGMYSLILVTLVWFYWHKRTTFSMPATYWLVAGFAAVLTPYFIYILLHRAEFSGQLIVHQSRLAFLPPKLLAQNLLREPLRYRHLLQVLGYSGSYRSPSSLLFVILIIPIFGNLFRRWRNERQTGDFLLLTSLFIFMVSLGLFEQVKVPLYTVILVPGVAIGMALLIVDSWCWFRDWTSSRLLRAGFSGIIILLMLFIAAEGTATYLFETVEGQGSDAYAQIGEQLEEKLPQESRIIGFELWWWPLRSHEYRSWLGLWKGWQWWDEKQGQSRDLASLIEDTGSTHLLVSAADYVYLDYYPAALQQQFRSIVEDCSQETGRIEHPVYGELIIYRLPYDTRGRLLCL